MAENEQQAAAGVQAGPGTRFSLQRLYVKDSSFESPNSPDCFRQNYQPKVDFNIGNKSEVIDAEKNLYEVALKLTATVTQDDNTMFLAEVEQAGVFEISGFDDQAMGMVLSVTCPTILFPYGREAIDALVTRGSFPALMLAPISFEAIYAQAQQQRAQQGEAPVVESPAGQESH